MDKDAEIVAKELELEKLKADRAKANIQEYPRWVSDPADPSMGFVVENAAQEAAVKKGIAAGTGAHAFDKTPEEQEASKVAGAKSRLAGPESKAKVKGRK